MFSLDIVDNDVFLDMPQTSQLLYYHLSMRADDHGFITPKKVMRMMGANDDDLKVLISKRYVLPFDSGVVVIKHWKINNTIRQDRSRKTTFQKELKELVLNEFGAYTERRKMLETVEGVEKHATLHNKKTEVDNVGTNPWLPKRGQMTTQNRIEENNTIVLAKANTRESGKPNSHMTLKKFLSLLVKTLGHSEQTKLTEKRLRLLKVRLKTFSPEEVLRAAKNISQDSFLQGNNNSGKRYGTIDYLLRSDENIDNYLQVQEAQRFA